MNFHSSTQPYVRSVVQVGAGQRPLRSGIGRFPVSFVFYRSVLKFLCLLFPLVFAINMYVGASIGKVDKSIVMVDNEHHQLMDKNIELRARKALIRGPEQLQRLAAEKLALYVHTKGQVGRYNYRKGYFTYP